MTKPGYIIGIIIFFISVIIFFTLLSMIAKGDGSEEEFKYMLYSVVGVAIGSALIFSNSTSKQERQEYEDYKRMKRQENAMYYRFKDAKGTPFEEYNMDDRTKLMVYYDRLPPNIKKKIVDDVDRIYRQFVNDLYTKK